MKVGGKSPTNINIRLPLSRRNSSGVINALGVAFASLMPNHDLDVNVWDVCPIAVLIYSADSLSFIENTASHYNWQ
jgi:hypothetical protein